MNVSLWGLQAVLAAVFGLAGITHAAQRKEKLRPMASWGEEFTLTQLRLIGGASTLDGRRGQPRTRRSP
ncbi:DoxX family protein [Nonomuraea sp. SMC257]|uniref:DoxX family protein n=1 Tax=Nonomuraea montanisoli TaxID=2741721 RepID=A0A7Y6M2T2_9ACTN|nr:DoxX family protein [Nonomuraea montanisoli]NUW31715.1 DoxX family protein [Nonomuraea montanisoli]